MSIGLVLGVGFLLLCIIFFLSRLMSRKTRKPVVKPTPGKTQAVTAVATSPDLSNVSDDVLLSAAAWRLKQIAEQKHVDRVKDELKNIAIDRMTPVPSSFAPSSNPNPAAETPSPHEMPKPAEPAPATVAAASPAA